MKISKRLKAISKHVLHNEILADIGSDHGLLPCYLIENKIINKAYSCDINEKPLLQAKRNISNMCLNDSITTILSDGLENVPDDTKQIVIAGMGFETIKIIFENNINKLNNYKRIIVQSNTDVDILRKWIYDNNYNLVLEDIVKDNFYYHILIFNTSIRKDIDELNIKYGLDFNHPLFKDLMNNKLNVINNILINLDSNNEKFTHFTKEKEEIINILENI